MSRACPLCGGTHGGRVWETVDAIATRCARCGTAYLSYRSDRADAIARETYEQLYGDDEAVSDLTAMSYETALRRFQTYRHTGRILDIGCGAGAFLAVATRAGWEAVGTETASTAGVLGKAAGATVLHGGSASALLPDESLDVVTMWEVIEHVENPLELASEARRLLRPGGLLFLTTPNFASLQRHLLGRRWPRFHLEHLSYFDQGTLSRLLERAGLLVRTAYTKNLDPFVVLSCLLGGPSGAEASADGRYCTRGDEASNGQQILRRLLKTTSMGQLAGRLVNRVLAVGRLGDTLIAEAERPGIESSKRASGAVRGRCR